CAAGFLERRREGLLVDAGVEPSPLEGHARRALPLRLVAIDVPVHLDVRRSPARADLDALVDELATRADRDQRVELLDVLRVEAEAPHTRTPAPPPEGGCPRRAG